MSTYGQSQNVSLRAAYIIADPEGNALTNTNNPNALEWTMPALFDDENKKAVTFHNPYQIPARIAAQLTEDHQIFRVHIPEQIHHADMEAGLIADFMGNYTPLQKHPLMEDPNKNDLWKHADRIR